MTRRGKINLVLYIAGISFCLFMYLFTVVNVWFGIGILASMFTASMMFETIDKIKWNNGICAKYNEPWEFSSYGDLSDGDTSYSFECEDQFHSFGRTFMHKVMREYKGTIKLKGL